MISRRATLAGALTFGAAPLLARAQNLRFTLNGSLVQGSLVVGRTEPDASVSLDGSALLVSPQGLFAFGMRYDARDAQDLRVTFADGKTQSQSVTPHIRQYQIQRINGLPQNYVSPPPDVLARIRREAANIANVRTRDTDGVGFAQPFDWPAPGIISSVYGSQRVLDGKPMAPHLGVDIAAPEGTPIRAPADGTVTLADAYYLDGNLTLLDHGHGVSTCYVHQRVTQVAVGDHVLRGQVIGEIGQTGRATGPNLHWGLNWFQMKLDPSLSTRESAPPAL